MSRFHERLRIKAEVVALEKEIEQRWATLPKKTKTDVALHEAGRMLQMRDPDMRDFSTEEIIVQILQHIDNVVPPTKNFTSVWNLDGAAKYVVKRWDDSAIHVSRKKPVRSRASERRAWWKMQRKELKRREGIVSGQ
jgi:hypothetical protein